MFLTGLRPKSWQSLNSNGTVRVVGLLNEAYALRRCAAASDLRRRELGKAFGGLHLRLLAEQCLKLSLHTAPIRQTCR